MSAASATIQPSKTARPSIRQVYFIARLALRFAGHELPETKDQASDLIQTLQAMLDGEAAKSAPVGEDCPF